MTSSIRHYLFPENAEPLRLSQRLVNGLIRGDDAMPQFANSRQRVLTVVIRNVEGKLVEIDRAEASVWGFDGEGEIVDSLREAVGEAMNSVEWNRQDPSKVVSLGPRLSKKKLVEKFRWEPSKEDFERITRDLWPKVKADRLKDAKGISVRPPPFTYEARHALEKVSGGFWEATQQLSSLKEPSLKGFAFHARKKAKEELEYRHLYGALAQMADDEIELKRRHKSGKGIWYAVIEVLQTRPEGYTETVRVIRERCEDRDAAVIAMRRLVAENAGLLGSDTTFAPSVITDIEWDVMAAPDD